MRSRLWAIGFALLALGPACTGTETGNPSLRGQMGFAGRSSMPLQVGLPGDGAPVEVTTLHAYVESIDLAAAAECETITAGRVELAGVGAVDLLQPAENVREMGIAEDVYCAARLRLAPAPVEGVAPELAGRSLALGGRRSDGTPFLWATAEPVLVEMPAIDALFIVDPDHLAYVAGLDVAEALARADLDSAVVGADGIAHLDDPANAALGALVAAGISPATALHRDHDADGALDPDDLPVVHGDH